jgi:hypothetical protein
MMSHFVERCITFSTEASVIDSPALWTYYSCPRIAAFFAEIVICIHRSIAE